MAKFNKGDLVEVTKSLRGNVGYRFIVGNSKYINPLGYGVVFAYESDVKASYGYLEYEWSPEQNLKLIKPDEASDTSFEELMLNLKQPQGETIYE